MARVLPRRTALPPAPWQEPGSQCLKISSFIRSLRNLSVFNADTSGEGRISSSWICFSRPACLLCKALIYDASIGIAPLTYGPDPAVATPDHPVDRRQLNASQFKNSRHPDTHARAALLGCDSIRPVTPDDSLPHPVSAIVIKPHFAECDKRIWRQIGSLFAGLRRAEKMMIWVAGLASHRVIEPAPSIRTPLRLGECDT